MKVAKRSAQHYVVRSGPLRNNITLTKRLSVKRLTHNNAFFLCLRVALHGDNTYIYIIKTVQGFKKMANITSNKIRKQVLADYNHCCAACGCTDHEALQIDHVIPQSLGGSDEIENLQVLCYVCNVTIKNKVQTPKLSPAKPSGSVKKWKAGRRAFRAYINGLR